MIAAQVVQRVRQHKRGVGASIWKAGRSAKIEGRTGDVHLRQADGLSHPVLDAEIGRVEQRVRREQDVDPVETKARFVHDGRAERVSLIERENLAARLARVAEAGYRVSLQRGFAALLALERIVTVETIIGADVMADGERDLIYRKSVA